jgi:hypothetical protein
VPGNIIRKWAKDKRNEGVLQLVFRAISLQRCIFVSAYHILLLHIFHDVNVVWLCESERIATYDTFEDTVAAITDEWVLSSPEMVFGPWRTMSLLSDSKQIWCSKFGEACFNNDIACSNNWRSIKTRPNPTQSNNDQP